MNFSAIHKETGAYWDEIAGGYGGRDADDDTAFLKSGGSYFSEPERLLLGDLSPWCRRAIHLQCSHGNDALSLLRQGASEVIGVDISKRLLEIAERKTRALAAPAQWVHADILETPPHLNGTAALVYTGKGALCWMLDLEAWAQVVARLLVPGGRLFIWEGHPLDWVWDLDADGYALDPEHGDYFSEKFRDRLFSRVTEATPHYRQWTLGQIVSSVIDAGLVLDHLQEYPERFWNQFPNIPAETLRKLPHSFALLAHKP